LLLLVRLRKMLLPGDPVPSNSDTEHLINYASLVTRSPEAAAVYQTLRVMAADLLRFSSCSALCSKSIRTMVSIYLRH
jgi:hypothetical protein